MVTANPDSPLYKEIAQLIHSDQSPVGIDAKMTHILILEKLVKIEERLAKIEAELQSKA